MKYNKNNQSKTIVVSAILSITSVLSFAGVYILFITMNSVNTFTSSQSKSNKH